MISPVPSTASSPSTWWRVTPYLTARMPPALVATAAAEAGAALAGKHRVDEAVPRRRLVELAEASRPGCTTATWFSTSISRIGAHLAEREGAARAWHARSCQAGSRTARGDRHARSRAIRMTSPTSVAEWGSTTMSGACQRAWSDSSCQSSSLTSAPLSTRAGPSSVVSLSSAPSHLAILQAPVKAAGRF